MKTIDRVEVVKYARTWVNTPYHHNQRCKGVGVDCINFIGDVYQHFGGELLPYQNYSEMVRGNVVLDYVESLANLTRVDSDTDLLPGQVIVFRVLKTPRHLGIISEGDRFIHADNSHGVNRVIEQRFERWLSRIVARYDLTI